MAGTRSRRFRLLAPLVVAWLATQATAQEPAERGAIRGVVLGAESEQPVPDVVVRVAGRPGTVSDERGFFRIDSVSAGPTRITFEHLAYGTYVRTIEVVAGRATDVRVTIAPRALELDEIVVEALSELEERSLTTGFSVNAIGGERIDAAARAGMDLAELLQTAMPGVDTRPAVGNAVCVTYRPIRSGSSSSSGCDGVEVRLDGVPISDPAYIYRSLPLRDIERIEMMSPAQAGARYGMRSGQSILLIETKSSTASVRSDRSRYLTGWSWDEEAQPYPWLKVFASSLLANGAAVGLSLHFAEGCFRTPEGQPLALRTECGPLATTGASVGAVVVPSLTGGFTARWAGTTDRSRGRLVPSMVASSMALTGGYLLLLSGGPTQEAVGMGVLFVGVPLVQTFTDRVLRLLR